MSTIEHVGTSKDLAIGRLRKQSIQVPDAGESRLAGRSTSGQFRTRLQVEGRTPEDGPPRSGALVAPWVLPLIRQITLGPMPPPWSIKSCG